MEMNVWKRGWMPWTYPRNWIDNFKNLKRCICYSWQRITKGYCDWDAWSLDGTICEYLAGTLTHLADHNHGHPYDMTEEEWDSYLRTMAAFFKDYLEEEHENIYEDAISCGDLEIIQKYEEEEKKIYKYRQMALHAALTMLEKKMGDLWD